MRLYIIRHAESENFTQNIPLSDDPRLSLNGKAQARLLGEKLGSSSVDLLISSTTRRALETAEILKPILDTELQYDPVLKDTKLSKEYLQPVRSNFLDVLSSLKRVKTPVHEHDSGDESFEDLELRAKRFIEALSIYEKNILINTHSAFTRVLTLQLILGKNITPDNVKALHVNHTGLTIFEKQDGQWRLLSFNDVSHLNQLPTLTNLSPV